MEPNGLSRGDYVLGIDHDLVADALGGLAGEVAGRAEDARHQIVEDLGDRGASVLVFGKAVKDRGHIVQELTRTDAR